MEFLDRWDFRALLFCQWAKKLCFWQIGAGLERCFHTQSQDHVKIFLQTFAILHFWKLDHLLFLEQRRLILRAFRSPLDSFQLVLTFDFFRFCKMFSNTFTNIHYVHNHPKFQGDIIPIWIPKSIDFIVR